MIRSLSRHICFASWLYQEIRQDPKRELDTAMRHMSDYEEILEK